MAQIMPSQDMLLLDLHTPLSLFNLQGIQPSVTIFTSFCNLCEEGQKSHSLDIK